MDGKYTAPLQLYLTSVLIISTVLAIQPLPKESSDWCAKDNATRYVVPPPEPVPQNQSELEPFPTFSCAPMTQGECDTMGLLKIPKCVGKSVVDLNLKHQTTREDETLQKYRNISLGIPTIRTDRAVSFGIWDSYLLVSSVVVGIDYNVLPEDKFVRQALEPIRKNIIELTLYGCSYRCPGKLPALNLTSLLSFTIQECAYNNRKPVVFRRGDFVHNIRLRAVIADKCFWLDVDPFMFTNLPDLRLLALEKNFFQSKSMWIDDYDKKVTTQLKKLHCECDYAWLRDLYRVNPGLVTLKPAGHIYEVCGAISPAFENKEIFVPVNYINCSKTIGASESDYNWKKGFFGDAQRLTVTYQLSICMSVLLAGSLLL